MTTERLLELVMLTNTFDSIIHASGVNENGEIEFEGGRQSYGNKADRTL